MPALYNILVELERCGQTVTPLSESEVKLRCPFHDDDAPSCALNVEKCLFKCHAATCGKSGDGFTLLAGILKTTRATVYADIARRYGIEDVKIIEPSLVERYHRALDDHPHLLSELHARGVQSVDIRKYRLGASDQPGRITIPITNKGGDYVNVRHYAPGALGADKMKNVRGHSKMRLYPVEQLSYPKIIVCGGELKAIVTARAMNKYGYGAITATAGEGNWDPEFSVELRDKEVWLMFDVDEGGHQAVRRVAPQVHLTARRVFVVELPLDLDKYPHGDVNDFIGREHRDLKPVIDAAKEWAPRATSDIGENDEPTDVKFTVAYRSTNVGKKLGLQATVTAAGETSFIVPRAVRVSCEKDQKFCVACSAYPRDLEEEFILSKENPGMLGMVDVSHKQVYETLKLSIGVPTMCGACVLNTTAWYDAELVQLSPAIDVTNLDTERRVQPALFVDCAAELNSTSNLVGRLYPHPKTQQATLIVSQSEITHDALTSYNPENVERFRVFRPTTDSVEAIQARLDSIYDDLESNVTRIFLRRDLHLMVDLAYHSVLFLDLDGKRVKAWVEVLVVGDNGQGKTETAVHLQRHYRLGELVDCKNASSAGLLGGMQKFGDAWYVSWGALPSNDRRLVILEELKGARTSDIAHLTSARSSGLAEIVKIKKRKTHSRTRIVALSNAREDRTLSSFPHAIDSILPLIGAPEDVRRFDVALTLMASDTDADALGDLMQAPSKVPHHYTSDLCHDLILWAWTRTPEQVTIEDEAREEMTRGAKTLAAKYVDSPPLIDKSTTRAKLARLSTALACRLFSTDTAMQCVVVKKAHVEFVVAMLDRVYSASNSGYAASSQNARVTVELGDVREVHQYLLGSRYPRELQQQLLYADQIDIIDVQDWLGTSDRQEAQTLLSLLVRKRALVRRKNRYAKTPKFIDWLKTLELPEGGPPSDDLNPDKEKF